MKPSELRRAIRVAADAARTAGDVMRRNFRAVKTVQSSTQHDIKLELDVRCQKLIERALLKAFPDIAILGEEGVAGDGASPLRWVVDPIDGTVNFTYGIPHACVSIALQKTRDGEEGEGQPDAAFETVAGVVYDPFCEEMWTAIRGGPARLNGRPVRVSTRRRLDEAIVTLGFGKFDSRLREMLSILTALTHRVRKIRIMGSAALALTYVASGRFDAYLESGVRLWDIAAGGVIVECAGGDFDHQQVEGEHVYALNVTNGALRRALTRHLRPVVA
ncbi:MAG: inositol monophosphatase family protein [Limisphaerales bacterium]